MIRIERCNKNFRLNVDGAVSDWGTGEMVVRVGEHLTDGTNVYLKCQFTQKPIKVLMEIPQRTGCHPIYHNNVYYVRLSTHTHILIVGEEHRSCMIENDIELRGFKVDVASGIITKDLKDE